MCLRQREREKEGDLPSTEARFTMIVLASSTGSRLDFVCQPRVFFLQTFVWILYATVCKAEQYFNVEVRSAVVERVCFPLSTPPSHFFLSPRSNKNPVASQPAGRASPQPGHTPVSAAGNELPSPAPPPRRCVSPGDPVTGGRGAGERGPSAGHGGDRGRGV